MKKLSLKRQRSTDSWYQRHTQVWQGVLRGMGVVKTEPCLDQGSLGQRHVLRAFMSHKPLSQRLPLLLSAVLQIPWGFKCPRTPTTQSEPTASPPRSALLQYEIQCLDIPVTARTQTTQQLCFKNPVVSWGLSSWTFRHEISNSSMPALVSWTTLLFSILVLLLSSLTD